MAATRAQGEQVSHPMIAISAPVLVMCLARWSSPTKESGGLAEAPDKSACADVLRALITAIPWELRLAVEHTRPKSVALPSGGRLPSGLVVQRDGSVILDEQAVECQQFCLQNKACFNALANLGRSSFFAVVCGLGSHRRLLPDLAQLAGWLGDMFEWSLAHPAPAHASGTSASSSRMPTQIVLRQADDLFGDGCSQWMADQMLVAYWVANQDASAGARQISLATDKSRIGGRGKYNTAIVLPSNRAWWAPPQARQKGQLS